MKLENIISKLSSIYLPLSCEILPRQAKAGQREGHTRHTRRSTSIQLLSCSLLCWCSFLSLFSSCATCVCSIIFPTEATNTHQRITVAENHTHLLYTLNISTHFKLHIYTPVLLCLFCFVLFCFFFKVCVSFGSRSPSPCQNMSRTTEHVGHWEDLETWLSVATDSLPPKAAETLKHQTQDQLDDNITSLMGQDQSQSYSHKELAKITGSLSHTLIATLKLSDRHASHLQQELTRAQWRIELLELEAQE